MVLERFLPDSMEIGSEMGTLPMAEYFPRTRWAQLRVSLKSPKRILICQIFSMLGVFLERRKRYQIILAEKEGARVYILQTGRFQNEWFWSRLQNNGMPSWKAVCLVVQAQVSKVQRKFLAMMNFEYVFVKSTLWTEVWLRQIILVLIKPIFSMSQATVLMSIGRFECRRICVTFDSVSICVFCYLFSR